MPDPYISRSPNELIRAADWNQIQVSTRTEIQGHTHTGGEQGVPLGTNAIQDGAIVWSKLDPALQDLLNDLQAQITALQAQIEGLDPDGGASGPTGP